jgi:hypothetical protein
MRPVPVVRSLYLRPPSVLHRRPQSSPLANPGISPKTINLLLLAVRSKVRRFQETGDIGAGNTRRHVHFFRIIGDKSTLSGPSEKSPSHNPRRQFIPREFWVYLVSQSRSPHDDQDCERGIVLITFYESGRRFRVMDMHGRAPTYRRCEPENQREFV